MSPFEKVRDLYRGNPVPIEIYIAWYMENGLLFCTPDFFVMGRPVVVDRFDPEKWDLFTREEADAWFIHAMAGDMSRVWPMMPYSLPKVGWERIRGGEKTLQFYRIEDCS